MALPRLYTTIQLPWRYHVILDAYCGCGTTVAVAQRLNRHWIGIDITYQSIAVILKRLGEHFGTAVVDAITLDGIPRDMASVRALANKKDDRLRKEFEKWAVLTYSQHMAVINEKKGADKGIDGIAYLKTGTATSEQVLFQVKSGKVGRAQAEQLRGAMEREQAAMVILITLESPTEKMQEEALAAGLYEHPLLDRKFPRIEIVTIEDMIHNNRRMQFRLHIDPLKKATAIAH